MRALRGGVRRASCARAGIPARVVTGYQGGEFNPRGDYLIVRQSDAHAWTEALIDGAWQRFDPTGAVSPLRIESGISRRCRTRSSCRCSRGLDSSLLKNAELDARRAQSRVAPQRRRLRSGSASTSCGARSTSSPTRRGR
ncbi:MAG: transglutaminase domain-containing protein [Comamonadaceae bacterium]|nr:transglutaminase domain-containing protein [Comamonadaceae bacterium]